MEKFITFAYLVFLCAILYKGVDATKLHKVEQKDDGKIVGGYNTTIQQIPYQVYLLLQKGNTFFQCGGSIISARYVLTAAHCLNGIEKIYVRAGSTSSDSGGTQYTTSTYKVHPQYTSEGNDYDIAVIRLNQDMKLDGKTTRTVRLAKEGSTVPAGTQILVSGWGTTSENGNTSRNVMAVQVPVVSRADCQKAYGNTITARMICAGVPQGGKDSCQGDSGGPAVRSGTQVGIVSFGIGCARPKYPGVYSNVANLRAWIKANSGV